MQNILISLPLAVIFFDRLYTSDQIGGGKNCQRHHKHKWCPIRTYPSVGQRQTFNQFQESNSDWLISTNYTDKPTL